MSYATRSDLEARCGLDEIAQRESMLPAGAVDRALADADAEIDSYLASRFSVPVTPVPERLTSVACVIARYVLLGESASERARNDYTDARNWLRDVQSGKAVLSATLLSVAGGTTDTVQVTNGRDKTFFGGLNA